MVRVSGSDKEPDGEFDMTDFGPSAYETLLRKVRTGDSPDDLQIIRDATDDFIQPASKKTPTSAIRRLQVVR